MHTVPPKGGSSVFPYVRMTALLYWRVDGPFLLFYGSFYANEALKSVQR